MNPEYARPEPEQSAKATESDMRIAKRYMRKAVKQLVDNSAFQAIAIEDENDYVSFTMYYSQRLLRTSIYDSSWYLSHPITQRAQRIPGMKRLINLVDRVNESEKNALKTIEMMTQSHINETYHSQEERHHARTLELAANDLVARATINDKHKSRTRVFLSEEIILPWAQRWKGALDRSSKQDNLIPSQNT